MENLVDLTPVVVAVVTLFGALITAFVVPYIKAKTTAAQQQVLAALVTVAVQAAEQLYGSGTGDQKKEYVIAWLEARGYTVDLDKLDAMVESAVYTLTGKSAADAGT